jgi:hypothetical protein
MEKPEALNLRNGDQVYWTDPDGGICSKYITIQSISITGDVARITDMDGEYLECYVHELS